ATLYRAQTVTATPNRAASSKSMQIRCKNTRRFLMIAADHNHFWHTAEQPTSHQKGPVFLGGNVPHQLRPVTLSCTSQSDRKQCWVPLHIAFSDSLPIMAAGGEYVVPPETVSEIGRGDVNHGQAVLDAFVKRVRAEHIAQLKKLPGPA